MFQSVAHIYQDSLKKSEYTHKLKYDPDVVMCTEKKRSRRKNPLYFNPPFSVSVKTNVGAKFLKLIDKHFPKSNPLSKIVNRKIIKMSYRTTTNMKNVISSHNQKVIRKNENAEVKKMCNCRTPPCPLQGKCLTDNLVYQATVKTESDVQTYVGLTSTTFKLRLGNHKKSFKNENYRRNTSLSSYIWNIKERGEEYQLKWNILGRAQPFSPISGVCNLCTLEKYHILFTPNLATLNKKEEVNNHCLHRISMLLDKT